MIPRAKVLKQVSRGDSRAQITPEIIATSSLMLLFTYDFAKAPSFLKSNPGAVPRNGQRDGRIRG